LRLPVFIVTDLAEERNPPAVSLDDDDL